MVLTLGNTIHGRIYFITFLKKQPILITHKDSSTIICDNVHDVVLGTLLLILSKHLDFRHHSQYL